MNVNQTIFSLPGSHVPPQYVGMQKIKTLHCRRESPAVGAQGVTQEQLPLSAEQVIFLKQAVIEQADCSKCQQHISSCHRLPCAR